MLRAIVCCLLLCVSFVKNSNAVDWFAMTPLAVNSAGFVRATYSITESEAGERESNFSFGGNIKAHAESSGYLYRPWIAKFKLGGDISYDSNQFDLNTLQETQSTNYGASMGVDLFSAYDYPVKILHRVTWGDFNGRINNESFQSYTSVNGNYHVKGQPDRYQFVYLAQQNDSTLDDRTSDNRTLEFTWNREQESHRLEAKIQSTLYNLEMRQQGGAAIIDEQRSQQFSLLHDYRPADGKNISSSLNFGSLQRENGAFNSDESRLRLMSFGQFLDKDRPEIRYTFNLLGDVAEFDDVGGVIGQRDTRTTLYNAGMFYDISRHWTLQSSFSGNISNTDTASASSEVRNNQIFTGLNYRNYWQLAEQVQYNLGLNQNLRNQFTSGQNDASYEALFDHGLIWTGQLWQGVYNLSVSEQLQSTFSNNKQIEEEGRQLGHLIAFNWTEPGASIRTNFLISVNDLRSIAEPQNNAQQFNLQLGRQEILTKRAGWSANLVGQYTRTQTLSEGVSTTRSLSGNISYYNRQLFGVANLALRSNLNLPLDDYVFDTGERANQRTNWETVVEYRVGLLEVRSNLVLTDSTHYFRIEARRYFGLDD